jgi:hypothetical protein
LLRNNEGGADIRKECSLQSCGAELEFPQIGKTLVVAQQGVLIAQLFRLQAAEALADRLGFRRVGTPLSKAAGQS